MLFSEREIDALRLLCWCQYIGMDDMRKLLTETEQCSLHDVLGVCRHGYV